MTTKTHAGTTTIGEVEVEEAAADAGEAEAEVEGHSVGVKVSETLVEGLVCFICKEGKLCFLILSLSLSLSYRERESECRI